MNVRTLSVAWSVIRTIAMLFVSAVVLGGLAIAAALTLLAATFVLNVGGMIVHALVAGFKVLGPLVRAALILAGGLLGLRRHGWA